MADFLVGPTRPFTTIGAAVTAYQAAGNGAHTITVDAGTYILTGQFNPTSNIGIKTFILRAAVGSEWLGIPTQGVRIDANLNQVQFQQGSGAQNIVILNMNSSVTCFLNTTFVNMQIRTTGNGVSTFAGIGGATYFNCTIVNTDNANGFTGFSATGGNNYYYNCASWNFRIGFNSAETSNRFYNCWSIQRSGGLSSFSGSYSSANCSNNASLDATAPGPNSLLSVTNFAFVNATNRDFHLTFGSALRNAGVNLSSVFTQDFDLITITEWCIGPDSFSTACSTDIWNYNPTVSSTPWKLQFGSPTVLNGVARLSGDDILQRVAYNSTGGWVYTFTCSFGIGTLNRTYDEFIACVTSTGTTVRWPSIKYVRSTGHLILGGNLYGQSFSGAFGSFNQTDCGVITSSTILTVALFYKSTANTIACKVTVGGDVYYSTFVNNSAFVTSFYVPQLILNNQGNISDNATNLLFINPITYRLGLSDSEVMLIYNVLNVCGDLAESVHESSTAASPWVNNNEPHQNQKEAEYPSLRKQYSAPLPGLGKSKPVRQAKNPVLKTQRPEKSPGLDKGGNKTPVSFTSSQLKKGYKDGFVSILPESGGYGKTTVSVGTGNKVYLLSDSLQTGKGFVEKDNVRDSREQRSRTPLCIEPQGRFSHEFRSNDSLALFQSHFQNRIGTTPAIGTTYYEFTPHKSRMNIGGSSFGTGSYLAGSTQDAFTVSVFKRVNGSSYHYKSGICDSLRFDFDPKAAVEVESDFKFGTVSLLGTGTLPYGGYSLLNPYKGYDCNINFLGLPLVGFTFQCKNNLKKISPVGTDVRFYQFGVYQVEGEATVDLPKSILQYVGTLLQNMTFPVYGTLYNDERDKIVFQMGSCSMDSISFGVNDGFAKIAFKSYESEDDSTPPIKFMVWTRNYSATTFEPN